MALDPIRHEYALPCSAEHAFAVYVERIGSWWHPAYTLDAATLQNVTIEPRFGGRVFATHRGLGDIEWGRVTVFEPGRRLIYVSTLAQPSEVPSEITVIFKAVDGGCTVAFEHGGWTEENGAFRDRFRDWRTILDRYALLASEWPPTRTADTAR